MGEMKWLDKTGDLKVLWDPKNEDETNAAEAQFDSLIKKDYRAFSVKKGGDKGKEIKKFDPDAGSIIMVPPLAGG